MVETVLLPPFATKKPRAHETAKINMATKKKRKLLA